ncbi:NUDIX hydrolase, partial [Myxococcota bacterium]|nr:NUDIX hydrolase [Myxococcota bacterium]
MKYTYSFPKADVTVDAVVFGLGVEGVLSLLLVRRGRPKEPFFDHWALPGGFIDMDETLEGSLLRELREETGLILPYMEQLGAFGDPGRDPRGRVITIAYLALVPPAAVKGGDDAAEAR